MHESFVLMDILNREYERAEAASQAASMQETETFWRGLFEQFQVKIVSETDAKYGKLEKEFSEVKIELSELKHLLYQSLTQRSSQQPPTSSKPPSVVLSQPTKPQTKTGQPSTSSKPTPKQQPLVSQRKTRGKSGSLITGRTQPTRKGNKTDVSAHKVHDTDLMQDNIQAYLLQKISDLSKDSSVPVFDQKARQRKEHPQPIEKASNINENVDNLLDINLTQSSQFDMEENTEDYLCRRFGDLTQESFVARF
ncbi:unnamed protein product [Microthlaspi erraticum]|uniref:Uncharacterized protein n=1 Tax=Microthlaspi erraticum TaxID=1685480 RepID=A0A6D2J3N0_9BRAS|nr:unnamed protein product [Microthlaspi erraticum]